MNAKPLSSFFDYKQKTMDYEPIFEVFTLGVVGLCIIYTAIKMATNPTTGKADSTQGKSDAQKQGEPKAVKKRKPIDVIGKLISQVKSLCNEVELKRGGLFIAGTEDPADLDLFKKRFFGLVRDILKRPINAGGNRGRQSKQVEPAAHIHFLDAYHIVSTCLQSKDKTEVFEALRLFGEKCQDQQ